MQRSYRILAISFLALLLAYPAPAKVLYVSADATGKHDGSSWQDAFTTIATGIEAATSADEIWVESATYQEAITLKNDVAVYGGFTGTEAKREQRDWQSNPTVIDSTGRDARAVVAAHRSNLDGFTIIADSSWRSIFAEYSALRFDNCLIRGNPDGTGGGRISRCLRQHSLTVP